MSEDNSEQLSVKQTLRDDEIVTERRLLPRRSFLSNSGAIVAGVLGVAAAARASAQDDPDKRPDDKTKPDDKAKKERRKDDRRTSDDQPKPEDRRKPGDQPKPDDTHKPDASR